MKIKLLKNLTLLGFVLFGVFAYAQTVSGVVSDNSGPLPGVNVFVKGTTIGAQTDFDGIYKLENVSSDAVIVFSFLGFKTQEVAVGNQTTINVTLEEDTAQLDEVVIIGYGTTTVKDATGAVASVKAEDFNQGVIASPEQLIQGKTAGIQIAQTSGQPGAGINIRIRGTASIRSNNNPLFVVDGVPLAGDATSAGSQDLGFGSSGSGNPLNFLNPNDIESISVLKDASSTAIYGSRGANGVVIITTKSGRGLIGQSFEYSSNISVSSIREDYNLLGPDEFLDAVGQFGGDVVAADYGNQTDWQDYIFRDAISVNQNFSYSNNYESGNVRATLSYGDQKGVVDGSGLERFTARINANQRLFDDKLKLGIQTTYSFENNRGPGLSSSAGFRGDLIGSAYSANPTWPTDPDFDTGAGLATPAAFATYVKNRTYVNRFLLNGFAEYQVTPELKAKVNVGYDQSKSDRNIAASPLARNLADDIFGAGRAYLGEVDVKNHLFELTLDYKKEFGNSKLDALVGYSFQDFGRSGRNVLGRGFNVNGITDLYDVVRDGSDIVESGINGSYQQWAIAPNGNFVNRLFPSPQTDNLNTPGNLGVSSLFGDYFDTTDEIQSVFARINYTIADKYLFTATVRADGSSRFSEDNQYGYFPSGAIAWKINEEDFIGDNVSTLKLRVSAGITGNQDGLGYGNFVRRERFAGLNIENGGNINNPGLSAVAFANPDLKWEETVSYGAGIDFGFNNDRLSGSIDVYRKETNDLLLRITAAQPSPQPFFFQNLDATVLNQGIEFAINYAIIEQEDFTWDASFNVSYNENELQDFNGQIQAGTIFGQGLSNAFAQMLAGGQPLFSYFTRSFEGFDANGQPISDDVQKFTGKSALPDFVGGFSTNISYKNWDFSAYLAGQYGAYIYNNTRNAFFTGGAIAGQRNVTPDVITAGESGQAEAAVSDRFLENGDFLRLQNASVGYNFNLKENAAFKMLRLSLTGQNLFVITPYSGPDPEVSTQGQDPLNGLPTAGIDYVAYPNPRTFTLGLFAKF